MSKKKLIGIFAVIVLIGAGISIWLSLRSYPKSINPPKKVTLATSSPSFSDYSIYVAFEKGFLDREGLDVTLVMYPHGKASLKAIVEGKVDMGTSSETPFMHAVLGGDKLYVFATLMTGEKHLGIVARKDRGIFAPKDLIGKSIGVTIGSNGEYFLDTVLLLHQIPWNQIIPVDLKPIQMYESLINAEVDAIATWNPQMTKARKELGDQGSTFYADGLYSPYFLITGRQDFINANPDIAEMVVKSLVTASEFIRVNRAESGKIVAKYLKMDSSLLDDLTATYNFRISLDQAFLKTLENQAKWAINNKLTDQTRVPDYLDYIYIDALTSVKPEGVTIIR